MERIAICITIRRLLKRREAISPAIELHRVRAPPHTHNLVRRVCAVHYCSCVASVLRHIVYIVDFHPTFVVFAGFLLDRLMILPLGAPQDAFAPKKGAPAPKKGALPQKKGALPQKRQLCPKKTRFRRLKSPPEARNRQAR